LSTGQNFRHGWSHGFRDFHLSNVVTGIW